MELQEMINVIQAFANGEKVQQRFIGENKWMNINNPLWCWDKFEYRVRSKHLPKTWEEFCENYDRKIGEARICDDGIIYVYATEDYRYPDYDKPLLPNENYAKAVQALCQLIQLRDCYNDGWIPNWEDRSEQKYTIYYCKNQLSTGSYFTQRHVLAFKEEGIRDEFLKNFRELIEKASPLL